MVPRSRVAVIVLNYNSLDDTLACVASIRGNVGRNWFLTVIDNASPQGDGTVLAERLAANEFLQLPCNTGYAGGNNAGIARALYAGAEFVLILNPDVRLTTEAITSYLRIMERHPDLGILSPLQYASEAGGLDEKFEQSILRQHGYSPERLLRAGVEDLLEVSRVLGAVMMIRSDVFRTTGGFDPLYFAYGEEEDFCRRAVARGWRIAVTIQAPALHLRTREQSAVSRRVLFLRTKGAYLLQMKNPSRRFAALVPRVIAQVLADCIRLPAGRYPFRQYPVRRRHVVLSLIWLLGHLPGIFLHRRWELGGAPYLDFRKPAR
jgi:GT2 family glycosyltransferase